MLISELTDKFLVYCSRNRAPPTLAFYRTRLRQFCRKYNERDFASLTPLEVDERKAKGLWPNERLRYSEVLDHLAAVIELEEWFPRMMAG